MECVEKMRAMRNVMPKDIRNDWDIICDSIEAERNLIVEAARAESAPARYFCERLEEAAKNREDVTLFGVDYVALPVDEDGVAIRPGDVIDGYNRTSEVTGLKLTRGSVSQSWFIFTDDGFMWEDSHAFKHHKEPDVTDILREFALACEDAGNAGPEVERLAAEYAEKLQLKEE